MKHQPEVAALVLGWTLAIAVGAGNGESQGLVLPPFPTEIACKAAGRKLVDKMKAQQAADAARYAAENPNVDPGMSPPTFRCIGDKRHRQ
jgi:hypothetical protein